MTALISSVHSLSFFVHPTYVVAGFVPDFQVEQARVDEQLNNATDEPTTGRQHFRLDRHRARTLATLQDRVWRSTMLLEICRSAFSRINQILFPTGPQPQGIHACSGSSGAPVPFETSSPRSLWMEQRNDGIHSKPASTYAATSTRSWIDVVAVAS